MQKSASGYKEGTERQQPRDKGQPSSSLPAVLLLYLALKDKYALKDPSQLTAAQLLSHLMYSAVLKSFLPLLNAQSHQGEHCVQKGELGVFQGEGGQSWEGYLCAAVLTLFPILGPI